MQHVRWLMESKYTAEDAGLPGNDDYGELATPYFNNHVLLLQEHLVPGMCGVLWDCTLSLEQSSTSWEAQPLRRQLSTFLMVIRKQWVCEVIVNH